MFFYASKLFWFVMAPTNGLILLTLAGGLLLFTRLRRTAHAAVLLGAGGLLITGISPLPYWLTRPLEDRFPRPDLAAGIDGVIVLGGAVGTVRGHVSLNELGARMSESAALAIRFPEARIAFAGGDASLVGDLDPIEAQTEAEAARRFYTSLGISESRLVFENQSRNTRENATLLKPLLSPKPGERWLLITSAWHMPRSVGVFRKAGFEVIPFPVDFTTRGVPRDYSQLNRGLSHGLRLTDTIVKEWIGLIAYRVAGYTDELLPGPR
jgi:uncharacterized SAM-binding protein YcdF (DUF218 family)